MRKRTTLSKGTREWIAAGRPAEATTIPGAAGYVIGDIHYWPGDMPDYCPACGGEDLHVGACDYITSNGQN